MDDPADMDRRPDILQLIWLAMLASIAIYAAIPFFLTLEPSESTPEMLMPLCALGVMVGAGSFSVRRLLEARAPSRPEVAAQMRLRAALVGMVMSEAVAICGLGLYLLGAGATWHWSFCAAAALLTCLHAPKDTATRRSAAELARPDVELG